MAGSDQAPVTGGMIVDPGGAVAEQRGVDDLSSVDGVVEGLPDQRVQQFLVTGFLVGVVVDDEVIERVARRLADRETGFLEL